MTFEDGLKRVKLKEWFLDSELQYQGRWSILSKKQFCPMEREAGDEDTALLESKRIECFIGIY